MDIKSIIAAMRQGIEIADQLAPVAAKLVPIPQVTAAAKIVDAVADLGRTVLDRAEEAQVVLTADDQVEIQQINETLAEKNAALAARVEAS